MKRLHVEKICLVFLAAAALILPTLSSATVSAASTTAFDMQSTQPAAFKYYALGDSVAAGLGLPQAPNASTEDIACGRSTQAYEATVATRLSQALKKTGRPLIAQNLSCSGATSANLTQPQTAGTVTVPPQLDGTLAPNLLTLTVGSNDLHYAEFINECTAASNCDTPENTAKVNAYIATLQTNLSNALLNIKARNHGLPPKVVVTGYYNPFSLLCTSKTFTIGEIGWVARQTKALNAALRQTSDKYDFARFAPVDFTGHDICSLDPWIQRPGVDPAPIHPTATGQYVIARSVLRELGL